LQSGAHTVLSQITREAVPQVMEVKIIDASFFLCAFESDSERIPRSSAGCPTIQQ